MVYSELATSWETLGLWAIGYMQFKSENADSCRCVFYHWNFKKNLMIKHFFSLYTNNLTSSDYWNLYWIIRQGAMWSHYWDEIQDQITKCFSDVLMSYQWEIEFCYIGSKIRDLMEFTTKSLVILWYQQYVYDQFFCLATSFPESRGLLITRKTPFAISISQHTLGTRLWI